MAEISVTFTVGGVLKTATTSAKLRDSTGTYGIKNNATGATAVAVTAALAPVAVGVYEYDISTLAVGSYTAVWEFIDSEAGTVYVPTVFSIDAATAVPTGVTLADIEQSLALRVGPYREVMAAAGASLSNVIVTELKTRQDRDEWSDLYLLRRGIMSDGSAVQGFDSTDRVRVCSNFDEAVGGVQADRDWTIAPATGEMLEFHHLHPEYELRKSVLAGLKRCFWLDLVTVTLTGAAAERDLTASLPWLSDPEWIYEAEWNYTALSPLTIPNRVPWFKAVRSGQTVLLRASGDPYPNTLKLRVLRPASSYVNGQTSTVGPNDDHDILPVTLEYAVAAGHVEAWRNFPSRMLAAAEEGFQVGRKEAVATFESLSARVYQGLPNRRPQYGEPYGGWVSATLVNG